MSSTKFLILIAAILMTYNDGSTIQAQPIATSSGDLYNLIEPRENLIDIWSKTRGKVNIKQLIQSMKKSDSKSIQNWNDDESINIDTITTTTTTTSSTSTTNLPQTARNLQQPIRTTHDNLERLTNLHEQIETDQKRFFHSAVEGWVF